MLQVPCPVRSTEDNAAFNAQWRSCQARSEPMVAVHQYGPEVARVYVNVGPSGKALPESLQHAIHGILIKFPVASQADGADFLGPELLLSARMTLEDAKIAADEIANYLRHWCAGLVVEAVAST